MRFLALWSRLRGKCTACDVLPAVISELRATVSAQAAELEATRSELRRAADRIKVLDQIERAVGRPSDEAYGVVLAWKADREQLETAQEALAEYMAENNLLRRQLHSVALQSMSTVDMMKTPLTDAEPPKRGSN